MISKRTIYVLFTIASLAAVAATMGGVGPSKWT
jgi:hypothetical protein